MKVHVNLQAAPNQNTGIGVYTFEITRELARYPELELRGGFSSLRGGHRDIWDSYPFPVHISRIPGRLLYGQHLLNALPLSYNTLMRDVSDVAVFFSNQLPNMRIKGRVIAVVHDLIPLKIQLEDPGIADRFRRQLDDIRARADTIVTVSEHSRKDICSTLGVDPSRVRVVPNGVDLMSFQSVVPSARRTAVRARYGLPERFILYFGGTRPYKNVDQIVTAYALLDSNTRKQVKLVITRMDADLQHLATKLGVANDVTFTRPIDDVDKVAIYQMAEVALLVSQYEGFGIPAIESMAAGTPVIVSSVASLPEVCGGAAALVKPGDPEGISHHLQQILHDPVTRQRMAHDGAVNASRYSWSKAGQEFYEVLVGVGTSAQRG